MKKPQLKGHKTTKQETSITHIVVNILLIRGDAILVERKYGESWKIPGGHVEDGESPIDAARREMREELGIKIAFFHPDKLFPDDEKAKCMPTPFASFEHAVSKDGVLNSPHVNFMYVYAAEPMGEPTPHEGQEIRWIGVNDVQELDNPYVKRLVDVALRSQMLKRENLNNG